MRVAFGELRIGEVAKGYIQRAIDKNWVSEGDNVRAFEAQFAARFGYGQAIATSSGTDADICACASLYDFGAVRGDEIICPATTFVASANAILAAGFVPRFVDINVETLNLDPGKIEAAINPRTRAIMAVHLMGKPCDMDAVTDIARAHQLMVIEDACESHGAKYRNKYIGTIGDMGTFSYYAAHVVICGEGGMVVTNNAALADVLRSVKSHGRPTGSNYFDFQRIGFNSRMNELTAAIGLEGIARFDQVFEKRKGNLNRLLELTRGLREYCYFLEEAPHEVISPHAFPLVLRDDSLDRDRLYAHLESNGIQCKNLFGSLPTQHAVFKFLGYHHGNFPQAEFVGRNGLHFGTHQYLDAGDLEFIADTLTGYFRSRGG